MEKIANSDYSHYYARWVCFVRSCQHHLVDWYWMDCGHSTVVGIKCSPSRVGFNEFCHENIKESVLITSWKLKQRYSAWYTVEWTAVSSAKYSQYRLHASNAATEKTLSPCLFWCVLLPSFWVYNRVIVCHCITCELWLGMKYGSLNDYHWFIQHDTTRSFFVTVEAPDTIRRGEQIGLRLDIFSNWDQDMEVWRILLWQNLFFCFNGFCDIRAESWKWCDCSVSALNPRVVYWMLVLHKC